jgi:hypothetical protein
MSSPRGTARDGRAARERYATRSRLDWSERRPHLGGALRAVLASRLFELGWVKRRPKNRS